VPPDEISPVTSETSVSLYDDVDCTAVDKSPYALHLAVSVCYVYFMNHVGRIDIDGTFLSRVASSV
jgi:hypothetical protein